MVMAEKTHPYMECPQENGEPLNVLAPNHDLYLYDCGECEDYYLTDLHPDLCAYEVCDCLDTLSRGIINID